MKTKDSVLAFLENNRGFYVSGTKIAEQLNLSRNAVWKAIKQLEQEGYEIEGLTNKGYTLSERNPNISSVAIKQHLTAPFNELAIYCYESVDSTNKKAKELANEGAPHGTIVVANEQTSGKGRYGRSFESPKNTGIYLSIILRPEQLNFNNPTIVTSYAAVVVAKVIENLTKKQVKIKWVNDLYLNHKKVCGILTEAITNFETGRMEWIVLGIGINLSTEQAFFSKEVQQKAGSLLDVNEAPINRNAFIATLLKEILTLQETWSVAEIMHHYKARSLVIGKQVLVQRGREEYPAWVKDIDDEGQLVVETPQQTIEHLNSGEIRIFLN